jgi:hypothetical protein
VSTENKPTSREPFIPSGTPSLPIAAGREPFIPPKPAARGPLSSLSERDQIISIFTTTVKIAQSGQLSPELFLSVADHLGRLADKNNR